MSAKRRLVVGMTGATGAVYTVRLLQVLQACPDIETHLVISPSGVLNIKYELDIGRHEIQALADQVHSFRDVGATLASGSFPTAGMVIVPCSMRTLAAVAHGLSDNLITRAADVTLKERRRLVMMVRETPFNLAHLRNMTAVTEMGAIVMPPVPAFYTLPQTTADITAQIAARAVDLLRLTPPRAIAWDPKEGKRP